MGGERLKHKACTVCQWSVSEIERHKVVVENSIQDIEVLYSMSMWAYRQQKG